CHGPCAELAELVRRPDDDLVYGRNTAAERIRCPELYQRLSHVDAHHMDRTQADQRWNRQPRYSRRTENNGEEAEQRYACHHHQSGIVAQRISSKPDRGGECPNAGGGSEHAERPRTKVKDVTGIDWQERHRPAEEYGK